MDQFLGRKSGNACVRSNKTARSKRREPNSLASEISKTKIDKLGDRLKKGNITEADLRLLDEYRRSFTEAYETIVGIIRNEVTLEPTGRPAKSTTAISEKLLRETIRLTQVQDIAGCRLIVVDMVEQERVVQRLSKLFDNVTIVDRRKQPSHGYRAVHVIVKTPAKLVEIQVRTALQHAWAELSEKLSDVIDPAIKYGRGDKSVMKPLLNLSAVVARQEVKEAKLAKIESDILVLMSEGSLSPDQEQVVVNLKRTADEHQKKHAAVREESLSLLRSIKDDVQRGA